MDQSYCVNNTIFSKLQLDLTDANVYPTRAVSKGGEVEEQRKNGKTLDSSR